MAIHSDGINVIFPCWLLIGLILLIKCLNSILANMLMFLWKNHETQVKC